MGVVRAQHFAHTNQNFSFMCSCAYILLSMLLFHCIWVRQTTFINSFIHHILPYSGKKYTTLLMSTWDDFSYFIPTTEIYIYFCWFALLIQVLLWEKKMKSNANLLKHNSHETNSQLNLSFSMGLFNSKNKISFASGWF